MKQTQSQIYASKVLRLNQWGKIAITIFNDEAIEHGIAKLKNFKDVHNPYKYFLSEAKQYCVQHGIEFNYKLCNALQEQYKMPADTDVFVEAAPEIKPSDKYYSHKEVELDYDNEIRKWHEMVINWDNIVDPKKKCAKGYELTYPGYVEWLKKIPLTTFLDSNPPDVLVYMDESKLTLLDAMRK